jgi:hypothetical protein
MKITSSSNHCAAFDMFELGAWGMGQMVCSVFCCCVPIFNSLVPSGAFFDRVKSLASFKSFSSTFGSRSGSSAVNNTMHAGSVAGTAIHDESKWGWLEIDGSEIKGSVTTEIYRPVTGSDSGQNSEHSYPMKTVVTEQRVETMV